MSKKNIILQDKKAEEIWEQVEFPLKGKSKSKWLAYYMAMRAAIYDEWIERQFEEDNKKIVLHIGCGLDGRVERVSNRNIKWYDIDFPEVIKERCKYYPETDHYKMLGTDMRTNAWKEQIEGNQDAIIVLEGVSMYFAPQELESLLSNFAGHFRSVRLLIDCYTEKAAKVSKYKNPINDVGVTLVYGYDDPQEIAVKTGLMFIKEHDMTPQKYIEELHGVERSIFRHLYAGRIANSLYRMYEFG